MPALQNGNPNDLEILKVMPGSRVQEKQLHWRFEGYHWPSVRKVHEWFRAVPELLEFITKESIEPMADPRKSCPQCGEYMESGDTPHPTVERIVRANMKFGKHRSGERVLIDVKDVDHGSTRLGTMSIEEFDALKAKKAKKAAPAGRTSVDLAREFSERSQFEFAREKERRVHAAKRGQEKADAMVADEAAG